MSQPSDPRPESARWVVRDDQVGVRLDSLLASCFPAYSRVCLRRLINSNDAQVNAHRCKAAYRVRAGDVVTVQFPEQVAEQVVEGPEPEDVPLDVLYEDSCLAVINKPHGMVVHPSKGHWRGTLTAALAHRFGQMSQAGGASRPGIVHRLDRDTSGVMVVARDDQAHRILSKQFEHRSVEKEYFAICRGQLDRDRDRIERPIGPHPYQREKMAIRTAHPASRPASTFYEVDERFVGFVSVRVHPKTGRTHQIRVHLAHVRCPVLCDPLYSGQNRFTLGDIVDGAADDRIILRRLALHSRRLSFDHPSDGRRLTFQSPIPQELQEVLAKLRELRSQRG